MMDMVGECNGGRFKLHQVTQARSSLRCLQWELGLNKWMNESKKRCESIVPLMYWLKIIKLWNTNTKKTKKTDKKTSKKRKLRKVSHGTRKMTRLHYRKEHTS